MIRRLLYFPKAVAFPKAVGVAAAPFSSGRTSSDEVFDSAAAYSSSQKREIVLPKLEYWKDKNSGLSKGSDPSQDLEKMKQNISETCQASKPKKFLDLNSLTVETIDLFVKEKEKKGVSVTQAFLVGWAKSLADFSMPKSAIEIFRWMEKEKMIFSPEVLAIYVDLILKVEGLEAARAYFKQVDPNFNNLDPDAKNWPAYSIIEVAIFEMRRKSPLRRQFGLSKGSHNLDASQDLEKMKQNISETWQASKPEKFLDLNSLTVETIDLIVKEKEKKGVSVTQAYLVSWAKSLADFSMPKSAIEIFRWMEKEKMIFSPEVLAIYVDLILKVEGLEAARAYFIQVDPNFNNLDPDAKNWPAYSIIEEAIFEMRRKSPLTRQFGLPPGW